MGPADPGRRARLRIRSLRLRAVLVVVLVLLAPLGLVGATSVIERGVGERMRVNVRVAADEAAARLADGELDENDARALRELALRHKVRLRVVAATASVDEDYEAGAGAISSLGSALFFGPDGAPTLRAFDDALGPLADRAEMRAARASGQDEACRTSPGGKLLVCHAARASSDGGWSVYVQESSRRAVRALYDLRYQLLKLTLLVLPGALLLAWWLGWRMVRPLEALRRQALESVARRADDVTLRMSRRDEFGDLAAAFNLLLERLDARSRANERFALDVAHEFKNPVAAIRASAESLASASGEGLSAERAARLASVLQQSGRRLDALVTELLELARAEAGMHGEGRDDVDLRALGAGLLDGMRADERYAGLTFELQAPAALEVRAVPGRLETALRNLLDNAASFSPEGGRVTLTLERDDEGAVTVSVSDEGPGIPDAERDRVFERFTSSRAATGGTGLGLAMVKAIAEGHGGTARADAVEGRGARVSFTIPGVASDPGAV